MKIKSYFDGVYKTWIVCAGIRTPDHVMKWNSVGVSYIHYRMCVHVYRLKLYGKVVLCGACLHMYKKAIWYWYVYSDGLPVLLQLWFVASTYYNCLLTEVKRCYNLGFSVWAFLIFKAVVQKYLCVSLKSVGVPLLLPPWPHSSLPKNLIWALFLVSLHFVVVNEHYLYI